MKFASTTVVLSFVVSFVAAAPAPMSSSTTSASSTLSSSSTLSGTSTSTGTATVTTTTTAAGNTQAQATPQAHVINTSPNGTDACASYKFVTSINNLNFVGFGVPTDMLTAAQMCVDQASQYMLNNDGTLMDTSANMCLATNTDPQFGALFYATSCMSPNVTKFTVKDTMLSSDAGVVIDKGGYLGADPMGVNSALCQSQAGFCRPTYWLVAPPAKVRSHW